MATTVLPIRAITEGDLLALTEAIDNNEMPIDARDSVCLSILACVISVCNFQAHSLFQLGLTSLMHASQYGWPEIVSELLKRGADLNLQDKVRDKVVKEVDCKLDLRDMLNA